MPSGGTYAMYDGESSDDGDQELEEQFAALGMDGDDGDGDEFGLGTEDEQALLDELMRADGGVAALQGVLVGVTMHVARQPGLPEAAMARGVPPPEQPGRRVADQHRRGLGTPAAAGAQPIAATQLRPARRA